MAFANTSFSDVVATTIQHRSKKIADNVKKNNAAFARMNKKGNVRAVSGGDQIMEELSFAENGNFGWYSGADLLSVGAQDVISSAAYAWKQCATPVVINGLEKIQNAGRERQIDLLEARLRVAESTMANKMSEGLYSDGTGYGGKQLIGLLNLIPDNPATGVVGGIDRQTWTFWQSQTSPATSVTSSNIQGFMNTLWAKQVRGSDRPDLILSDSIMWSDYLASLQNLVRFTAADSGDLGFASIKYMDADVVLDGGIGGFAPSKRMYFLNTNYLSLRYAEDRNMVPLSPTRRVSVNQDAEIEIIAWAGALTMSNASLQGILVGT